MLIWPWCDIEMTLPWPWGNSSMKLNPNPCHHAYLDWALSDLIKVPTISPNMTIIVFFGPPMPFQTGVTSRWFNGVSPLQPLYFPFNLLFIFSITPCWGLGGVLPSHTLQVNIIGKKHIYFALFSWFDLAVTLRWPWDDLEMTLG